MNLHLNGNITVMNGQMGDVNTMTINCSDSKVVLQEQDWNELDRFLRMRLSEVHENENSYMLVKESLNYTEKRDEMGLKGFLKRNKESFINNVISNVASSGIICLLSKLNF